MKNKTNKIIILTIIGVALVVSAIVFVLNYSKDESSFSLIEKKWLKDNTNNIIDVSIYNDIPVYGKNGKGISFEYLDKFNEKYKLEFNKVSYLTDNNITYKNVAFRILKPTEQLSQKDILLYEDNYVLVSKEIKNIDKNSDLENSKIGVFNNEMSMINNYLSDVKAISYIPYKNINEIFNGLSKDEIEYAFIPKTMYLDEIIENEYKIVYHINDLGQKYVLTVNNNKTLLSIMKKYTNQFKDENYKKIYNNNFTNSMYTMSKISEAEIANYNSSPYVFGYVVAMPFTNITGGDFVGTISNYLSEFEDMFGVNFKLVKYDSIKALKQALSHGEVDVAFANFNTDGTNIDKIYTTSPFREDYVVIAKDYFPINSIKSLKNKKVYTIADSYIDDYLTTNDVKALKYNNSDELLRNIDNDGIVVIDKATYYYYQPRKFIDYKVIYEDKIDSDYKFVIRDVNKNQTLAKLFSNYVMDVDYNTIRYKFNTSYDLTKADLFITILKYSIVGLLIIFGLIFLMLGTKRLYRKEKNHIKDEKIKFIDMMTSLKNRNYLNYNIKKWEENVIYPQSIVIVDLNNIKYINDNFGHEEGDEVIKKAASILINNQLEKTDIMRTDGNEFLIYMIGYDEKNVISYTKKLYKELKELPHNFGGTIGYSMIEDDVKSIEDAINEATLDMRSQKENL